MDTSDSGTQYFIEHITLETVSSITDQLSYNYNNNNSSTT